MFKTTRRRTEITIETREIKTIRIRSVGGASYCGHCDEETNAYPPEQVAIFLQITLDEVAASTTSGHIHLIDNNARPGEICGRSLEGMGAVRQTTHHSGEIV